MMGWFIKEKGEGLRQLQKGEEVRKATKRSLE